MLHSAERYAAADCILIIDTGQPPRPICLDFAASLLWRSGVE